MPSRSFSDLAASSFNFDWASWYAARSAGLAVHYLPPYRADRTLQLADLLGVAPADVGPGASRELVRAVVEQRSVKTKETALLDEPAEVQKLPGWGEGMYQRHQ